MEGNAKMCVSEEQRLERCIGMIQDEIRKIVAEEIGKVVGNKVEVNIEVQEVDHRQKPTTATQRRDNDLQ